MKYLLDFDRTVFDMDALYTEIATVHPQAILGTLDSLKNIDLSKFIFADALRFFSTHNPTDISIVSSCYGKTAQWDMAYQTEKIKLSGVQQYVADIKIVPTDKVQTIKGLAGDTQLVFIDDHIEHVAAVRSALPQVRTLHIDRSKSAAALDQENTITTLDDVDAIINKL